MALVDPLTLGSSVFSTKPAVLANSLRD